jgi:hypothetical protein
MTEQFSRLANKKKHFLVKETGWSKIDSIYNDNLDFYDQQKKMISQYKLSPGLPIVLYAPTFPSKYTSASDLLPEIEKLKDQDYNWIVKFHPLMEKKIVENYKKLCDVNFQISDEINILLLMAGADIMLTDTSSVAYEFLHFNRPLITYKAIARVDKGIDIKEPSELHAAIERSLNDPGEFSPNRAINLNDVHPYSDGNSSKRVVKEIKNILDNGLQHHLKEKPINILRKYQIRKLFSKV